MAEGAYWFFSCQSCVRISVEDKNNRRSSLRNLYLGHSSEVLPVRVINPALDDRFIALVESVLDEEQSEHRSRVAARTAFLGMRLGGEFIELRPIDLLCKNDQRMSRSMILSSG